MIQKVVGWGLVAISMWFFYPIAWPIYQGKPLSDDWVYSLLYGTVFIFLGLGFLLTSSKPHN